MPRGDNPKLTNAEKSKRYRYRKKVAIQAEREEIAALRAEILRHRAEAASYRFKYEICAEELEKTRHVLHLVRVNNALKKVALPVVATPENPSSGSDIVGCDTENG